MRYVKTPSVFTGNVRPKGVGSVAEAAVKSHLLPDFDRTQDKLLSVLADVAKRLSAERIRASDRQHRYLLAVVVHNINSLSTKTEQNSR
jgi:hypothetical protein